MRVYDIVKIRVSEVFLLTYNVFLKENYMNQELIRPNGHLGAMTKESEYFAIGNLLAGVPKGASHSVDALVAWPGIIFDVAVSEAVIEWNCIDHKHLLVAGYDLEDVAKEHFLIPALVTKYGIRRPGSVYSQILAFHAGHQAQWVAEMVVKLNIKSIALFVPNFHLPRAYLTTIEALRRVGQLIPIIPVAPPVSPFRRCVLNASPGGIRNLTTMDVIHAEVARMISYSQAKADGSPGDVATTQAFMEYLEWLYQQEIVSNYLLPWRESD